MHCVTPAVEMEPGAQGAHAELFALENVPAKHSVHEDVLPGDTYPGEHSVGEVEPEMHCAPAGQGMSCEGVGQYQPAGHD